MPSMAFIFLTTSPKVAKSAALFRPRASEPQNSNDMKYNINYNIYFDYNIYYIILYYINSFEFWGSQ